MDEKREVSQDTFNLLSVEDRQYFYVAPPATTSTTIHGLSQKQGMAAQKRGTTPPKPETEAEFASWFEDFLHRKGYKFAHFRAGMTSRTYTNKKGETKNLWVTPVSGDGEGLPDYFVWHPGRRPHLGFRDSAFWVELKSEAGKLSDAQVSCIKSIRAAGPLVFIWRPSDRKEIEKLLE